MYSAPDMTDYDYLIGSVHYFKICNYRENNFRCACVIPRKYNIWKNRKENLRRKNKMKMHEIIAQGFGIIGMIVTFLSFQEKNNKKFFIKQGLAGLMFFLNFIIIGAVSAALFNLTNLVRGAILSKNDHKMWRVIFIVGLYTACFLFALTTIMGNGFQIFLSALTCTTLIIMTVLMWKGNGKHIRYAQFLLSSPSWIVHNIFNFSLGGLICEIASMISVIISFIRYGKDGFEKE